MLWLWVRELITFPTSLSSVFVWSGQLVSSGSRMTQRSCPTSCLPSPTCWVSPGRPTWCRRSRCSVHCRSLSAEWSATSPDSSSSSPSYVSSLCSLSTLFPRVSVVHSLRDGVLPSRDWKRPRGRPPTTWIHHICRDTGIPVTDALELVVDSSGDKSQHWDATRREWMNEWMNSLPIPI